ncbi:tigger transposable element-derived protein 1-like [Gigantopelta aegis]|uniref:tigger transposable element-derived protein 1-like n=1 Tax=Gigantopelta aegis TaxID=1735272 RepID=UPI001B88DA6E|nr:tigger transposable element-derived protein 1-like [Gigantopelta aegis]
MPIKKAAAVFSVPYSTLHDSVSGKIQLECTRSGPETLLLITGRGADFSPKGKEDKKLSLQWFYSFMKRWPELKVQKPRSLEIMRAKATSEETVNTYFNELETILNKYNLKNSPQSIYNIDEKGIVENHKPPSVVSSCFEVPVAVTLGKSNTRTVIGCGNALGVAIPPYFVFKGQRMRQEFLSGCTAGTAGTVSETGWSNSEIFQMYLSDPDLSTFNFTKYAPPASSEQPILILYDGHKSHINISLIQWARETNIIIFVLPAHTSHVLQPMDVGCFGPFETIYNGMKYTYLREHATSGIDRYSLCEIACKAYCSAVTPVNLQASFRKTGIYPFNRSVLKP